MNRLTRALSALGVLGIAAACGNAGADRAFGITASGIVRGFVYFDANGSGTFDASDTPVAGVRVRLVTPIAGDTVVRATSEADGSFRVAGVPVGSYRVVIDAASVGDTVQVAGAGTSTVTVLPNDSISIDGVVRYPTQAIAQVRSGVIGTRVFVTGVALHAISTFSDTLLHVVDTSGAIRATRVRSSPAVAGDSIRLRGRIAMRDGQPVLDDVSVFVIGAAFIPTAPTVSSDVARTASTGALDAALVRVLDAALVDTATVSGSLRLTVNDGSGPLTVILDRTADATFRPPYAAGRWTAGDRYDLVGVLTPLGVGTWALRPRTGFDLTER